MSGYCFKVGIWIGCLLSAAFLTGCPCRFEEPKLSSSIRRAPICAGATNDAEQQAIDDLAAALRESGRGMICWQGDFPPEAAAAFAASGVDPKFEREGRFVVIHPSVAVTVYEWNADSTALVPVIHSEAPRELNPCPGGLSWSGRWGYWRSDGRVEVVINCGDPADLGPFPRLIFDPASLAWAVDAQAGSVHLASYSFDPPVNLVVEGKVRSSDGISHPVAFDPVYEVNGRYAVGYGTGSIQNLATGTIFEFPDGPFLNPSGTRLAVNDREAGVVRVYDLTGAEPVERLEFETPSEWLGLEGFPGDRVIQATAQQIDNRGLLPIAYLFTLLIDSETGGIFDIGEGIGGTLFDGLFSTRTKHPETP
jgi:hypothetical protein